MLMGASKQGIGRIIKKTIGTFTYGKGEWEGDKYEGKWKNGKRHGHGTYTWSNGVKFVGEWKDGKRHGHGTTWDNVTSPTAENLKGVGFLTPPVLPVGFCYSDPNNSHWYLAKTVDESGWSSGDSCYTPSGSITPYGGQSCIGGSGLTSCISACETAGINCNSK